jgi:cysteine desulfurase/selenocysteine lyase
LRALPVQHRAGGRRTDACRLGRAAFDPHFIRRDFPILDQSANRRPLVWLDNAATTQKPQAVIDRLIFFYENENSNVHRGAHTLAARSTDAYESARGKVRTFIDTPSPESIIFVRGATEGINLIAKAWGGRNINKDDEIVIAHLEHHANISRWTPTSSSSRATRCSPRRHRRRLRAPEHSREDGVPGPPYRFEAGTGNIADAVGLGAATSRTVVTALRKYSRGVSS